MDMSTAATLLSAQLASHLIPGRLLTVPRCVNYYCATRVTPDTWPFSDCARCVNYDHTHTVV